MALTKSQKVFKRAIMLRKKTGMSLKAAFKAAKKGGAEGEASESMAAALKEVADKMPEMPSAPGGPAALGGEDKKPDLKKEGGRRRTRGRGKSAGRRTRRRS